MRTFAAIGAALALASGAAVTAASAAREPQQPRVHISEDQNGDGRVVVADVVQEVSGDQEPMRHLAVLAGGGPRLGLSIRDLDADQQKAAAQGVVVDDVRDGSAAQKAGILKGDVIAEFDGERVRSARQLQRLVSETADGRSVRAVVMRDGKRVEVTVAPDSQSRAEGPREFEFAMPGRGEWNLPGLDRESRRMLERELPRRRFDVFIAPGRGRLGVGVQDLTPQLAEYFGAKDGVLVTSVEADSPAGKAGLKAGDVITSIDGKPVTEPSTLIDAVRSADDGAVVTVDYLRDRKQASSKATLPASEKPARRERAKPI